MGLAGGLHQGVVHLGGGGVLSQTLLSTPKTTRLYTIETFVGKPVNPMNTVCVRRTHHEPQWEEINRREEEAGREGEGKQGGGRVEGEKHGCLKWFRCLVAFELKGQLKRFTLSRGLQDSEGFI